MTIAQLQARVIENVDDINARLKSGQLVHGWELDNLGDQLKSLGANVSQEASHG